MTMRERLEREAEVCEKMSRIDGDARERNEWKRRARRYRRWAKELKPEVASREWRGEHL